MAIKKGIFLAFFWLLSLNIALSQKTTLSNANIDDFPQVELEFNYKNPVLLDSANIKCLENGKSINNFTLEEKPTNTSIKSKQVLILIENSYWQRFDKQLSQVKQLWSEIAGKVIGKDDEVFIATFDWSKGSNTIHLLNEQAMNSPSQVNDLIQSISAPSKDGRKHKSTEIFPALLEGVSFLNNQNKNDSVAQAILLFSSEFNNIYNNTQTKTDVVISARNSGIPIYPFRYPYSSKYTLQDIAEKTYGYQLDMMEANNEKVIKWINQIPERYAGKNYSLHFESSIDANSDFRDVEIVVSDEESLELRYQSPSKWSVIWKNKSYRFIIIALGVLLVALIIGGLYLIKKRRSKQVEHLQSIEEDIENVIHQNEVKRTEEKHLQEEIEKQKQKKEFEEELQIHFNRLPRLAKLIPSEGSESEVLKPVYYIGRRSENDLSFNNSSVSKVHAIIYYDHVPDSLQFLNEKQYIIVDFDSTNGTFVNGNLISSLSEVKSGANPQRLTNSDLIQMGEVSITFID